VSIELRAPENSYQSEIKRIDGLLRRFTSRKDAPGVWMVNVAKGICVVFVGFDQVARLCERREVMSLTAQ
jgi:hypothetical protein